MKRIHLFITAPIIALAINGTGLNAKESTRTDLILTEDLTFDSLSVFRTSTTDSVAFIAWAAKAGGYSPAAHAIMEHFSEQLGGTYAGNPVTDAKDMLNYYADSIHNELLHHPNAPFIHENSLQLFRGMEMSKTAETGAYVTMTITTGSYDGGAHGMMTSEGFTVRKCDGRIIGREIIRPFKDEQQQAEWNNILRRQLQKELEAATDDELSQMLLLDSNLIPMPQSAPYLTPEGLHLVWQPYEIAPYAAGILHVVVPKEEAMKYLNITGQRLLQSR